MLLVSAVQHCESAISIHINIQMNLLQNRNRIIDVENKLRITNGERGGGINWEIGIDIYILLYVNIK